MPDISLPFEILSVAFGGIPVIAFIFALIQILKSFAPEDTNPQVWRGLAVVLGIVGCLFWQSGESGLPTTPAGWLTNLITGVVFGYLAMRLYDQTLTDAEKALIKKTLRRTDHTLVIDMNGLSAEEAKAKVQEMLKAVVIQNAKATPADGFYKSVDNGGRTPV
jgi:hypothetical protein